jgi:hypothetical protein
MASWEYESPITLGNVAGYPESEQWILHGSVLPVSVGDVRGKSYKDQARIVAEVFVYPLPARAKVDQEEAKKTQASGWFLDVEVFRVFARDVNLWQVLLHKERRYATRDQAQAAAATMRQELETYDFVAIPAQYNTVVKLSTRTLSKRDIILGTTLHNRRPYAQFSIGRSAPVD